MIEAASYPRMTATIQMIESTSIRVHQQAEREKDEIDHYLVAPEEAFIESIAFLVSATSVTKM